MQLLGAHEQMRLKVTAFLFNSRADALRGEVYRALCLHVLSEAGAPCSHEEVVELIAYVLGSDVKVAHSLTTVVLDELRRLASEGVIQCDDECYFLPENGARQLPDAAGQEQLYKVILQELRDIAGSLNPEISTTCLNSLLDFYLEVSNIVAQHQLAFICKGYGVEGIAPDLEETCAAVSECIERYGVDKFLDVEQFVLKSLIRPSEALSNYLHRLVQVHIITQLLAWDPALEYLQSTVLSGKTLYIDSSVLFVMMQQSDRQHYFLQSLLRASHDDLEVELRVHEMTLEEYRQVMRWAEVQFDHSHKDLRQIAEICKRDGDDPADYIDSSILADYVSTNIDHVDLGSWQRYFTYCTGKPLEDTLASFSIEVDSRPCYVPKAEFYDIKEALLQASKIQMERKKRSRIKEDTTHDAKMYYLIDSTRHREHLGELSWGYDTYLLTLDGSLVHFRKLYNIPWSDQYFIYPNQWYELTFPFLRIRTSESPDFVAGLTSLVFSGAFPNLTSLIPLELCTYVFDLGGTDLPMGSIRNVIEGLIEKRLVESLDPGNQDQRKREEARIQVQRMIVEEQLKQGGAVAELEALSQTRDRMEADVEELGAMEKELAVEIAAKVADVEKYGGVDAKIEAIRLRSDERIAELETKHSAELAELQREKDRERAERDEASQGLQNQIDGLKESLEQRQREDQQEKDRQKARKAKQMLAIKKYVVTALMLFSLLVSLALLVQFSIRIEMILLTMCLMVLGLILYAGLLPGLWPLVIYGLGTVLAFGTVLVVKKLDVWLWAIPMLWEVLVFGVERFLQERTSEQ